MSAISQVAYLSRLSLRRAARTAATALRCPGGLAAFKLCSFASRLTRDERMQSLATGSEGRIALSSEPGSNYSRLNPLTRRVMKGFADSFETPRRGYLFVSVRLLKLEQRRRRRRRKGRSVRLIFARESCEELWKQHVGPSAFSLLLIADALSVTQHFPCTTT